MIQSDRAGVAEQYERIGVDSVCRFVLFDRSLLGSLVTTTQLVSNVHTAGIVKSTATNILGPTNTPGSLERSASGNSGSTQSLSTASNVQARPSQILDGQRQSHAWICGLVLFASSESVSVLIRALSNPANWKFCLVRRSVCW